MAIEARGLEKRYRGFELGPVDLEIPTGTVLALVGPNGAGKTTLMDMLGGLLRPDGGRVAILGRETLGGDATWKWSVGHVSEQQPFFERWSGARNLAFLADHFPDWRWERERELVSRLDLPLEKPVKVLSRGNRVKLAIVAALARSPRVLLLDEPTAGLDPLVRSEVLDTLWSLVEDGEHTILYSTHILSDLDRLADEIAFIRGGRLLLRVSRDRLEQDWRALTFRLASSAIPAWLRARRSDGDLHQGITDDFPKASDQLLAIGATQLEARRMSLEEISVHILRDAPPCPGAATGGGC